jgi:glycine/D-amino acid oxidase-like deaminating enzyme
MRLPDSRSLWVDTAPAHDRSGTTLPGTADVVVLGAGIAGLTAACRLAEAGRDVVVLEAGQVAAGVSGNTTAKVTAQHGLRYDRLVRNKDLAGAAEYAAAQLEALEWIERGVGSGGVDCSFQRVSTWIYSTRPQDREAYAKEAQACRRVGLAATLLTRPRSPSPWRRPCVSTARRSSTHAAGCSTSRNGSRRREGASSSSAGPPAWTAAPS